MYDWFQNLSYKKVMDKAKIIEVLEGMTFSDLPYIEYCLNKKDFESGGNYIYNNSGNIYRFIDDYYKDKTSLLEHIKNKENEIIDFMNQIKICQTIDLENLALILFKNKYKSDDEYLKYNLLGWKLAFSETMKEFINFIDGDSFYLTDEVLVQIKFIEKLLFDARCICNTNSFRRKRIMPGIELLPVYEETIRGYMVSDYARPSTSIFVMRQIIELKIRRTLGIECVYNKKYNNEEMIELSKLIKFIEKKEKNNEVVSPVSINLLKAINISTNRYIHTGNFGNFLSWHEKIGQIILRDLCFKENEFKTHIEGSFIIRKSLVDNMEFELRNFLKWDENIECYFSKPEATVID